MQKNLVRVIGLIVITLLEYVFVAAPVSAIEVVDTAWVRTYNGPGNSTDWGIGIALDSSRNVYVTGGSTGSGTYEDYATIKYYPDGTTAWTKRYNGTGDSTDIPSFVTVDNSGNVYVTGKSYRGSSDYDYLTIKYYPNGDTAWVRAYNGPGNGDDEAWGLDVDAAGNVYVGGWSVDTSGYQDYAAVKYSSIGEEEWIKRYNGPGDLWDDILALTVTDSGKVYVTGQSVGSGTNYDLTSIKYNTNGSLGWTQRYNGSGNFGDYGYAIALDSSENMYVAGASFGVEGNRDYITIKYDSSGSQKWDKRYNGPANDWDQINDVEVDKSKNVYVSGRSMGSATGYDYATIKYDSLGNELWLRRFNGPDSSDDEAFAVVVDNPGNVYVTGYSTGTGSYTDYATIKYKPNGDTAWITRYSGPVAWYDYSRAIAIDGDNNVLVTGQINQSGSGYDYCTIKYVQYDTDTYDSIPFAPAVCYETENNFSSIFCADLDGDADLDLAGAAFDLFILNNNGDGTFEFDSSYAVEFGPFSLFCAELDADGDLDIAVGGAESESIWVFKNWGDGSFQNRINYGLVRGASSIFCADLNGDADFDLAVANAGTSTVSIFTNNREGVFQLDGDYAVGDDPFSVFSGKLDADAYFDLAVANRGSENVSILKNNGDGTFQGFLNFGAGNGPNSVFCGDLDGDNDLDLVVANLWGNNISILKNYGEGTFESAVNYGVGMGPNSIFCADLDGDTYLDLVVANLYSDSISILKNNGDGSFQAAIYYDVYNPPYSVFCADLDADGDFDLAVGTSDGVCILENLTQVPANQPPWAFHLVSPSGTDTTFRVVNFDWQDAYDPNFGDQIRYDLYISTSEGFEPQYTNVDSNLLVSKHIDTLESETYYWRVKAKDNWGAYRWSSEMHSFFNSDTIPDPLFIIAFCPVDLIVFDPLGDSIGIDFNTIPNATYDTTTDWNGDTINDDIVTIPDPWIGTYKIAVKAEPQGKGEYTLAIRIDEGEVKKLASDQPVPSPGAVDTFFFCCTCDMDSCYTIPTGIDVQMEEEQDSPHKFSLFQNYPNPFNLTTQIRFNLSKPGFVSLKIYDILGRRTRTLVSELLSSGHKSVVWNGKDDSGKEVASGIYFYQLKAGDYRETKKLVLLK